MKINNGQWYDEIMDTLSSNNPTAPTIILRQHLEAAIGDSERVPSVSCINKCLQRIEFKRKRCTFLSNAQDPVEVFDHMERMSTVEVERQ